MQRRRRWHWHASVSSSACIAALAIGQPVLTITMRLSVPLCTLLVTLFMGMSAAFVVSPSNIKSKNGAPFFSLATQPQQQAYRLSSSVILHVSTEDEKAQSSDYRNSVYGTNIERGPVLWFISLALCVWSFSIPVEFRRARFCSEQQVIDNPTSKCITFGNWAKNIASYYENGGGIQWDFSVEEEE